MKSILLLAFTILSFKLNAQVYKCQWRLQNEKPIYVKVDSLKNVIEINDTSFYDCEVEMSFYMIGWEMDTIIFDMFFTNPLCERFDFKPILSYFYEKKIKYATDRHCFIIKME